jgi:NADH-quinone oxidoreductase subunit E
VYDEGEAMQLDKDRLAIVGSNTVRSNVVSNRGKAPLPFRERKRLIPLLQKEQAKHSYLSEEAISEIAYNTGISKNEIYGVASFYAQFRFTPPGEHIIKVCLGTACHVRGGGSLLESLERELDVHPGGTTKDGKFSLERVACFGCCALAPVIVIDNNVYSRLNTTKIKKILAEYTLPKLRVEPVQSGVTRRWASYAPLYTVTAP